jgi:hypothetical protein
MGKSIVGLVAAAQMVAAGTPFYLVDADASTPNVGLTYDRDIYRDGTQERMIFTGDDREYPLLDRIFHIAETQDVLVVLPSQVTAYVQRWLEHSQVLEMLSDPDNTIDIVYLFVTNGTPESLDLFQQSVAAFDGKIPHVLVKNLGATTNINWDWFDEDGSIETLLEKYEK